MIECQDNYHSGTSQLRASKKMNPSAIERFIIYVREQEHMLKVHQQAGGESTIDLVSYVEFQRALAAAGAGEAGPGWGGGWRIALGCCAAQAAAYTCRCRRRPRLRPIMCTPCTIRTSCTRPAGNFRLLVRAHKVALYAVRDFWKLLLHHDISFRGLNASFKEIMAAQVKAEKTYRMILDRYPTSVKASARAPGVCRCGSAAALGQGPRPPPPPPPLPCCCHPSPRLQPACRPRAAL